MTQKAERVVLTIYCRSAGAFTFSRMGLKRMANSF
jgi:hypothetical protein